MAEIFDLQELAQLGLEHGSQVHDSKMNEELAVFSLADWKSLSAIILYKNVGDDMGSEMLDQYLNLFYKLFCGHLTSETSICERMEAICPNTRTMKDQFNLIQERFRSLSQEYETRNLLDLDTDVGRETKRKIGLIMYCIKTSYDFLTNARLLQHAHDPITRAALSELTPNTVLPQVDDARLDAELAQFNLEDWANLSLQLLSKNVDSDTESEMLHQYFNVFYKLFCCHLKSDTSLCERMKAICPSMRTMDEQFHLIQECFGSLYVEYEKRQLLDLETDVGRETKRKLGLISYCIHASYNFLTNERLFQPRHDPVTRMVFAQIPLNTGS